MISVTRIYQICLILICLVASEYLCATPLPVQDGYYWIQFDNATYASYYLKAASMSGGITYAGRSSQANILITRDPSGNFKLIDRTNNGVLGIYSPAQFMGQTWVITLGQATGALYAGAAASSFSGTAITGDTYATFGWKPISTPSSNIRLTFKAVATTDLHIAFQYNTNSYIELPIGGWGNAQSALRNFYAGRQQGGDFYFYSSSGKPIPDTVNPVSYTVTINAGVLTVMATTIGGVTSTIIAAYSNPSILNQTFTAYSFRMCPGTPSWRVANDIATGTAVAVTYTGTYSAVYNGVTQTVTATSTVSQADANTKAQTQWNSQYPTYTGTYSAVYNGVTQTITATSTVSQADANTKAQTQWNARYPMYTGTYGGYSAQSTLSQADADAKAQAVWAAAVLTSIGNSKTTAVNAVNPVLTVITNSRNALTAARKAFTDIALQLDTLAGQVGFTPKLSWQT